ncbi:MAG TPA: glycosyltransferase family 2 protein [Solirubrobacteraceae bacterium]|jgi:glycosyltransferase involved in cell wall biosynthesis|nr:glycosyltransferase family 2 protein [Solirubrobacteraceae bacterium]
MKLTVVTPSYNHAHFIERTIDSVLGQGYPELEYIVVDGGSTDGTVDILKRYGDHLIWSSEPDRGQSDAINKGLRRATGTVVAFLNSDDTYAPGALHRVGEFFEAHPGLMWAYGKCRIIDEHDREIRRPITWYKNALLRNYSFRKLLAENFISQPSTFWRRVLHDEIGYLNEDEHYVMDYEFWLRVGERYRAGVIDAYLANFRMYEASKSGSLQNPQFADELRVAKAFAGGARLPIYLHHFNHYKIVTVYRAMAAARRRRLASGR